MKTVVLTFESFVENARQIGGAGAEVLTAWDAERIAGADLLMVFLHPSGDGYAWVDGTGKFLAATYDVERADLRGSIVFLGVCYGVENERMIEALGKAGAQVVIAGSGVNYGGIDGILAGADWLAKGLRVLMEAGLPFWAAWPAARAITRVRAGPDAMGYKVVHKSQSVKSQPFQKVAGALAGALAVLAFIIQVIFGGSGRPTTFFSSIIPTYVAPSVTPIPHPTRIDQSSYYATLVATIYPTKPAITDTVYITPYYIHLPLILKDYPYVIRWEQVADLNGVEQTSTPVPIAAGDVIELEDRVFVSTTITDGIEMRLVSVWITPSLTYLYSNESAGTVITSPTGLTWTFSVSPYTLRALMSGWIVVTDTAGAITESLYISDSNWAITTWLSATLVDTKVMQFAPPTATPTATPTPQFAASKTGPSAGYGGQLVEYTLAVTSTGVAGVYTVIDTLPSDATLYSASPSGYSQTGYNPVILTWVVDDLATWSGTVQVFAPSVTTPTIITNTLKAIVGSVQVSSTVTTTISP